MSLMFLALIFMMNNYGVNGQTLSRVNTRNFTSDFSAEWYVYDPEDGVNPIKIRITLRLKNIDYSTWSSNGQSGVWLGIGFGETGMQNSDIVMC